MESAPTTTSTSTSHAVGTCATPSPFAIFDECPMCGEAMAPEHAHYRCTGCGWRDSCCD
jgi:predicted RNA-binding Zn-ribbon protein involved in translation (DUF1610 family)